MYCITKKIQLISRCSISKKKNSLTDIGKFRNATWKVVLQFYGHLIPLSQIQLFHCVLILHSHDCLLSWLKSFICIWSLLHCCYCVTFRPLETATGKIYLHSLHWKPYMHAPFYHRPFQCGHIYLKCNGNIRCIRSQGYTEFNISGRYRCYTEKNNSLVYNVNIIVASLQQLAIALCGAMHKISIDT